MQILLTGGILASSRRTVSTALPPDVTSRQRSQTFRELVCDLYVCAATSVALHCHYRRQQATTL